jgi:hypothetical protein
MMEEADMNWFCSPLLKPLAQPNVKNETMRRNDRFSNESILSFHVESFTKYSTESSDQHYQEYYLPLSEQHLQHPEYPYL